MANYKSFLKAFGLCLLTIFLFSFSFSPQRHKRRIHFPYKKIGLTERQAAAHMLNRFTFGATSQQIDDAMKIGLENWFLQQLDANLADDTLNSRLSQYDALQMSNAEIVCKFPKSNIVLKMALADSAVNKDSVNKGDPKAYKQQLDEYMKRKGFKPEQELYRQLISQKILRAVYSNNQLQEVLTDFWFNHFNVSITKSDCAQFILGYERDAIRKNAIGKFADLLMASAKSPAMLIYLDNFTSTGENTNPNIPGNEQLKKLLAEQLKMKKDTSQKQVQIVKKLEVARKTQGLNENYAREVMELHTLGVDGGYTQSDVTQAARILTGWSIFPLGPDSYNSGIKKLFDKLGEDSLARAGFVHKGDFLFIANRHDSREKIVLGQKFPAGGGYNEGVILLNMLAHHPSTAKFICEELAVHFVSDYPTATLVDKMTETFLAKDGNIKEVLITMVTSPEFWRKDVVRAKTKSPFEFAISAIKVLDANIDQPYQTFNLLDRMGEKIYYYQAPTGFPDKATYWINTGSLLNRMNFGLALATQRIPGIKIDLLAINNHHEPESSEAALNSYAKLLLPERNIDGTVKRLAPLLSDPQFAKRVNEASVKIAVPKPAAPINNDQKVSIEIKGDKKENKINLLTYNSSLLAQVVGIIIGSPEFQRK